MRLRLALLGLGALVTLALMRPESAQAQSLVTRCQTDFGGAATTDGQECSCRYPEAFLCENFEARPVGVALQSVMGPIFKNPGWASNNSGAQTIVASPIHDGSRSLQCFHAAVPSGTQAGCGFIDQNFPATRTIYVRWWARFEPGYVFAGNTSTKQIEVSNSTSSSMHIGHIKPNGLVHVVRQDFSPDTVEQNVGSPFILPNNGSWDCYEFRLTHNTGAGTQSAGDGILEGWINGVLKWSYPNFQLSSTGQNWNFIRMTGSGFGGDQAYPAETRWQDQLVVATTPIGCAAGAGGGLNVPANLQLCSGPGCTPAMIVPLASLAALLAWARRRVRSGR